MVERLDADGNIPRIGVPDMVVVIAMWHCASRFSFALDVLVTHLMHADHRVYYVWIRAAEASVPPAVRELRWGAKKVSSRRQIDSSSARRPDRTPAQLMAGNEQTQQIFSRGLLDQYCHQRKGAIVRGPQAAAGFWRARSPRHRPGAHTRGNCKR